MPTYVYRCESCDTGWDDVRSIADRHRPASEPCPTCEKVGTVALVPMAPAIGDSYRQGVTKLPDTWKDNLKRIKSAHRHSTVKV